MSITEAVAFFDAMHRKRGRGAFLKQRSQIERTDGALRSDDAGISSENLYEKYRRRKSKGSLS